MIDSTNPALVELTSRIVSVFVSNNFVPPANVPALMSDVHASLKKLTNGAPATAAAAEPLTPPVSMKKSVTDDYIVCLEDGFKFKSLKRHLATLGMTLEQYRAKWNLPASYPMVAPSYSAARSNLAKGMGLGNMRRKVVEGEPALQAAEPEAAPEPKKVGRPRKKAA